MDPIAMALAQSAKRTARQELLRVMLIQAELNTVLAEITSASAQGFMPRSELVDKLMAVNTKLVGALEELVNEGPA